MSPLEAIFPLAPQTNVKTERTGKDEYVINVSVGTPEERKIQIVCFTKSEVKKIDKANENVGEAVPAKQG
jgi:hypothetical protein